MKSLVVLRKGAFYKTFTRPVAKCALLAVLVYQLVYFGWSKLEADEIKQERQAEIVKLEAQVRALQAAREAEEAAAAAAASAAGDGRGEAKGSGWLWWRWK
ncbi:d6daae13-4e5d-4f9e-9059-6f3f5904714b [Thermothielavioides terrestris]|uniref:D6daae13-4e5d-4f9e-9059-6f3f5904714b n=1 Tax=Thermothielavioides terrestris TaxID=2587410 RepID=A0A3S5CWP9_9PEZI|nr:d6daae13-4e5d-4f9e-9059-6f3f5904714b [Thermothielavioides terrestris]